MENINKKRLEIIESLKLEKELEKFNPQTMTSADLKRNIIEKLDNGGLTTISSIVNVLTECNKIRVTDEEAFNFSERVSEKLNETLKPKIIFVYEDISSKRQSKLTESVRKKLNSFMEMEDETIRENVKSGSLEAFKSFSSIDLITESIKSKTENSEDSSKFEAHRPVSYFEHKGDNTFIRVGNQVICINEDNVYFSKSPNSKFTYISSVMENMDWNPEKKEFSINYGELGEFKVNENYIQRKNNGNSKIYEDNKKLIKDMNYIVESNSKNAFEKRGKAYKKELVDSVIKIKENWDSIALLDSFVVVENKSNNEKFTLFVYEGNTFVGVLKSNRYPNTFTKMENINEGVELLKKRSGYDAKNFFVENIEEFENVNEDNVEKAKAYRKVLNELEEKELDVATKIKEERAMDEPSKSKLEKLTNLQGKINALIIEQNNNLKNIL